MSVPVILSVGRLFKRKGHVHLVRALKQLGREVKLFIVGSGPERERLIAEAKASNIQLSLLQDLSSAELHALYTRAKVFVLPSVTDRKGLKEGFGLVLLEAMAHRVPVVAFANGGVVDVIEDGVTGYLVAEGDETLLAARIADALDGKLNVEIALQKITAKFSRRKLQVSMLDALARSFAGDFVTGTAYHPWLVPAS